MMKHSKLFSTLQPITITFIHYDYENDFPNNVFDIEGLSLNQCLSEPLANDTIDLLTAYNTLKQVRNDTAHANEEKKGRYTSSQDIRREIEGCLGIIRKLFGTYKKNVKI